MSVAGVGAYDSLSERSDRLALRYSDSDLTIIRHERASGIWPVYAATYSPTFDEDISDNDDDLESMPSSTMTNIVPPLTRGGSIASSSASAVQTDVASAVQGGFVLDSDDGILTLPASYHEDNADLLCPFQILECVETFSSVRDFKVHVFSHFRGQPLPTSATCFLCEERFEQTSEDDTALAWNRMLGHMAHHHYRRGEEYGTLRAGFALMRWMYDRKIISDHQYKRAQICPAPTLFPATSRRASEVSSVFTPEAPSPPLGNSPTSPASITSDATTWSRRSSYSSQTYVTFAGARAERRRRESFRPVVRQPTLAEQ